MLPIPSWKLIVEVNQPEQIAAGDREDGICDEYRSSEERPRRRFLDRRHAVKARTPSRFTGRRDAPEIHYLYSDGYLVAAATKDLLRTRCRTAAAGVRLDTSGTFLRLLPTDQHANFSG